MNIKNVKERAFAMPLTNPSYPKGPYEFRNREYFIVTYRTDPVALAKLNAGSDLDRWRYRRDK